MTQEFEVTAEELVRVLQRRGIPLPSEIGAFIVLEACEKLSSRPVQLSTREIFITEQGDVETAERLRAQSDAAAASALLGVLAELLVCAAPGVPAMLLDLVEHGPNERNLTLGLLRSDLEACLLPLNRAATRRVLSRLVREVRKTAPGGSARPVTPGIPGEVASDVDATFDDLLGDSIPPPKAASQVRVAAAAESSESSDRAQRAVNRARPTPLPRAGSRAAARRRASEAAGDREPITEPPARARREASEGAHDRRTDSLKAARESAFRGHSSQAPADVEPPSPRAKRPIASAPTEENTPSSPVSFVSHEPEEPLARRGRASDGGDSATRARQRAASEESRRPDARASGSLRDAEAVRGKSSRAPLDIDSMLEAQATRGRVGLWVFIASTAAAVALLLGYFALGREQAQSALGFLKPSAPPPQEKAAPALPARREYGDLRINSKPDRAQVLLLIGPGPALATDIPVGVAQEFVAIADNHRPARALLPADATWDELDGQPRYELAIQARPLGDGAGSRGRATDGLGATLLPRDVGSPRGRLGSVRLVTTPRAAHVYQLIGFTPDVHVDNLPLDHPYEILVYLEGKGSVQKHIEPSDFHQENGKRIASIDVQLSP